MSLVSLSRRYRFSASHRLYAKQLTEAENQATYGKCANPFGHGHDYEIEVTVEGAADPVTGRSVDLFALDELVEREILKVFRYRNLNEEIPAFENAVPTTENLAAESLKRLSRAWKGSFPGSLPRLERVRIWETERNICQIEPRD